MIKSILVGLTLSAAIAQTPPYQRGIVPNPCAQAIPAGHQFNLEFGQLCRFEADNAQLAPATDHRVVYFGDSITQGWANRTPGIQLDDVVNRGISGQTTSQMLVRFRSDVIKLQPKIVHLMMGTNDIAGNTGATTVTRLQDSIASMAEQARAAGIRVILATILPAKSFSWRANVATPVPSIRAVNKWMAAYAAKEGFTFVDYYSALAEADGSLKKIYSSDGVHPNSAGYDVMIPLAEDAIRRANQ